MDHAVVVLDTLPDGLGWLEPERDLLCSPEEETKLH